MTKVDSEQDAATKLWDPQKIPNVEGVDREAFKTINEWASAAKTWDTRVRAMCLIMEAHIGVSQGAFKRVLREVEAGNHDAGVARRILAEDREEQKKVQTGLKLTSDVVGHPPDPPFTPFT